MSEQLIAAASDEITNISKVIQKTALFLVDSDTEVDLVHFKTFLEVLRDSGVKSFSGFGFGINFRDENPFMGGSPAPKDGEVVLLNDTPGSVRKSTDVRDGWRHPSLWPQHNGRVLHFDGSVD